MTRAVVVGAGPNGLAAAIHLARHGVDVQVLEARDTIGGGARSGELTVPGVIHDHCSASHPFGVGSPFWKEIDLQRYGLTWKWPDIDCAHPLDDGSVGVLIGRSTRQRPAWAPTIPVAARGGRPCGRIRSAGAISAVGDRHSASPDPPRRLRPTRCAAGHGDGALVSHRAGTRTVRWRRRARLHPAGSPADRFARVDVPGQQCRYGWPVAKANPD